MSLCAGPPPVFTATVCIFHPTDCKTTFPMCESRGPSIFPSTNVRAEKKQWIQSEPLSSHIWDSAKRTVISVLLILSGAWIYRSARGFDSLCRYCCCIKTFYLQINQTQKPDNTFPQPHQAAWVKSIAAINKQPPLWCQGKIMCTETVLHNACTEGVQKSDFTRDASCMTGQILVLLFECFCSLLHRK